MPVGAFTIEPKQIAAAMVLGREEALQQMEMMEAQAVDGSLPCPSDGFNPVPGTGA